MSTKTVTFKEFVDAIEKNGFKQSRTSWIIENKDGTVRSACAMGQAAINLGVTATFSKFGYNIQGQIMDWNDDFHWSCQKIADKLREKYPGLMDIKVELEEKEWKLRNKKK